MFKRCVFIHLKAFLLLFFCNLLGYYDPTILFDHTSSINLKRDPDPNNLDTVPLSRANSTFQFILQFILHVFCNKCHLILIYYSSHSLLFTTTKLLPHFTPRILINISHCNHFLLVKHIIHLDHKSFH